MQKTPAIDPYFEAFESVGQATSRAISPSEQPTPADSEYLKSRWRLHKENFHERAAYILSLGRREGITGPKGLERLEKRYINSMNRRFGNGTSI